MSDITAIADLAKTIGSEHPGGTALVPRSTENLLDTDDLFVERTDLSVALPVLLSALGWHGNRRNLAEAVPLDTETLDLTGLRNLMANLNYRSRPARVSLDEIEPASSRVCFCRREATPLLPWSGVASVCWHSIRALAARDTWIRGAAAAWRISSGMWARKKAWSRQEGESWFRTLVDRFRGLIIGTVVVTFSLNLFALGPPLFVMSIYDWVIGRNSSQTLIYLAIGIGIAVLGDALLRRACGILAYLGARLDYLLGLLDIQAVAVTSLRPTRSGRPSARKSRVSRISKRYERSLPGTLPRISWNCRSSSSRSRLSRFSAAASCSCH